MVAYLKAINSLHALLSITIARGVLVFGGAAILIPIYGLSGAGMALLLAELPASLLLPLWHTRHILVSSSLGRSTMGALGSLVVVAVTFLFWCFSEFNSQFLPLLSGLIVVVFAFVQWAVLPVAGRERIQKIVARLIPPLARQTI